MKPLRSKRADWIATAVIAGVSVLAVTGAWATANIRQANLETHASAPEVAAWNELPDTLSVAAELPNALVPGQYRPLVVDGVLVTHEGPQIRGHSSTGEILWTYTRDDADLCSIGGAWDKVVAVYRTGVGCGDVVTINAADGTYSDTRSAINTDEVVPISSNDRVGTVSTERVELWRSDMVRTIEYGHVEAPQEPDQQPHPDCTITSAQTRTELLALTETCPDDTVWLRFLDTTPDDAREPEITAEVQLDNPGARLVAIGQDAAAVYEPGEQVVTYSSAGEQTGAWPTELSPHVRDSSTPFAPATADLPHHMSWFDGERLHLLRPSTLQIDHTFDQAIGTGVALGDKLVLPTPEGLELVNLTTWRTERSIDVDRDGYRGPVSLSMLGDALAETRGDHTVILR